MVKFRAWDKEEKEWLSIRTIGFDDDGSLWYLQACDDNENDIDPPYFEDDLGVKWELIQSTEIKDKNGFEIFEGDVVKHDPVPNPFFENTNFEIVQTRTGEWRIDSIRGGSVLAFHNHQVEIIGNKFEHKELLDYDSE